MQPTDKPIYQTHVQIFERGHNNARHIQPRDVNSKMFLRRIQNCLAKLVQKYLNVVICRNRSF